MKTSEEVYNRILTDVKFNPTNFVITYYDGIKQKYIDVPLLQWKPTKSGGDIPWTRVYYIKYKGKIVWNRIDLKYDIEDCGENINFLPSTIKVMSFNVLSDIYDNKITNMNKRKNDILNFISNSDCDIICLQEITPEFGNELEKLKFNNGQSKYIYLSTDSKTNNTIIMSKINPKSYEIVDLDGRGTKKALRVLFCTNEINVLNVIGIHLTSDTHKNSKSTRIQQISKICDKISWNEQNIILGDTNETGIIEQLDKFIDSNNSTTNTYNPQSNMLAKQLSSKGIGCRYDRIYHLNLDCEKFDVIENNTMSDHYPIIGTYKIKDNINNYVETKLYTCSNTKTTHKTSLCIIPPWKISKQIPSYNDRWMPHINLFWGFVPENEFNKYYSILSEIEFEPFVIKLNQIDMFVHENNTTIFIKPDLESMVRLKELYNKCSDIFGNKIVSEFNPHLSIETITSDKSILNKLEIENKYNFNFEFVVGGINFISRETTDYMVIKKIINFKKNNINEHVNSIINFLSDFCQIKICGSRFFANLLEQTTTLDTTDLSDLDLLGIGEIDREQFYNKLIKPIQQCGLFVKYEIIKNEHIYEMKLFTLQLTVDLQYVNSNNKYEKYYNTSLNIYAQPCMAQSLISDKLKLFKECLDWTKSILKKFKSYGQIYGYLSGMSIVIIVIYVIKKSNSQNISEYIKNLKNLNFNNIISLRDDIYLSSYKRKTKSDELMVIQELTHPYENTVRNITKSTKKIIVDIFKNNKITINLPYVITFVFESLDDENKYYLEELNNYLNNPIMKMIIGLEKNNDYVIKPFDKWYYSDDGKKLFFKIRHNCESNLVDHKIEKISSYSNKLINQKNISFSIDKKITKH